MDKQFYTNIESELSQDILPFWEKYARNTAQENFYTAIQPDTTSACSDTSTVDMVCGYLFAYSAAARLYRKTKYLDFADYAYKYLFHVFFDTLNGGMYHAINKDDDPLDDTKTLFAQSCALYAIAEYAAALKEVRKLDYPATVVFDKSLALYTMIERFARDKQNGGYTEILSANWTTSAQENGGSQKKNFTSHLMLLESYTNLLRTISIVYPEQKDTRSLISKSLEQLTALFTDKMLSKENHFCASYTADWLPLDAKTICFGRNIESSRALWEAANELSNSELCAKMRTVSIAIARTALVEGFDHTTGGFEHGQTETAHDTTRLWKDQAEALIGFYNAWELTGGEDFKNAFLKEWEWISARQKDAVNGEWFYAVAKDGTVDMTKEKGSNEKTAFYTARACITLLQKSGMTPGAV